MNILVAVGASEAFDTFFTPLVQETLQGLGTVIYNTTNRQAFTKEELIANISDVDILMTGWGSPCVDAEVLQHANRLKIHVHCAGSVANYVSKEEYDRGIVVLSGNDIFAKSVAEGCLCYTMNALRRIPEALTEIQNGGWRLENRANKGFSRKRIGIVGFGAISRYYMQLLRVFDVEVLLYSAHIDDATAQQYGATVASLEEIFATCDIISLHSALNNNTQNMIGQILLSSIQKGAHLINVARAELIERDAFYEALAENRFHAVLDVYYEEPLPVNDPLRTMPNVTLYPHMAGPTFDVREDVSLQLIEQVQYILANEPYEHAISYTQACRMSNK